MNEELNIYTGNLNYKDIDFSFLFDGKKLRLIPPKEKNEEIYNTWIMTPLTKGTYTWNRTLEMEQSYLIGKCNETGEKIIFLTRKGSRIDSNNTILFVNIFAYIVCKYSCDTINRITFNNPEINCVHPVNQALSYTLNVGEYTNKGIFSLKTLDFDATSSEKKTFEVDGKKVQSQFSISRILSTKILEPPITLNSILSFEFESTNNYDFILKLWYIAKEFIRFLCYRKNVFLPTADLSSLSENGKYEHFATLYILGEDDKVEEEILKKGRHIKYSYISGCEERILTDIANNLLYTRHFPTTYEQRRHIDVARFIMIITAFEWEFRRAYPTGVPKKESTIQTENVAMETLQSLINSSGGKLKKKYQFLKKLIKNDSLETEIVHIGKDYDDIIGPFGKYIYRLNKEEFNYAKIGKRLAEQRNRFAHGKLDKEFIDAALLDLIYLEYIIYAMQLRYYGVEEINIQRSINDLFGCNFAI